MPGTYPAAAPVLTGDSLAISRFLQNPELLRAGFATSATCGSSPTSC
jgi:hypothetical protein